MAGNRFFRRGVSKLFFGLDVTDWGDSYAGVQRADLTAATELSDDIAEMTGFELANSPIDTPNLADQFTPQIEGEDTVPSSSLTFYDRQEADDSGSIAGTSEKRTALEKGTAGFLFFLPYGDIEGARMEVWPVKSNGVNDMWTTGAEAARFNVPFSVSEVPLQNEEVPAEAV